jgi:hypothetical protein
MATPKIPYPDHGQGIFFFLLPLSSSRTTDISFIVAARLRVVHAIIDGQDEFGGE